MDKQTPARIRALTKAETNGFIMRPGGFSEDNPMPRDEAIETETFDTRQIIDVLVDERLLTFGEGSNQFVLTDAGRGALAADRAIKRRPRSVQPQTEAVAA